MFSVQKFLQRVAAGLAVLSSATIVLIMLIMVTDVTARNFVTGRSIPGAYELVQTVLVLSVAFGVTQAEALKANPRVTLLTNRLPSRVGAAVRLLGECVTVVVLLLVCYGVVTEAAASTVQGEFTLGLIPYPIWPTKIGLAFGFTVLALYVINDLVLSVRKLLRGATDEVEETTHVL